MLRLAGKRGGQSFRTRAPSRGRRCHGVLGKDEPENYVRGFFSRSPNNIRKKEPGDTVGQKV
jgi:hypothetical protein